MADIIGVIYPGGAGGAFLKSMVVYMLTDDNIDMNFDDGSSHHYYAHYLRTHPYGSLLSANGSKIPRKYELLGSVKSNLPFVDSAQMPVDLPFNLERIRSYNNSYKLIYVYFNTSDIYYIEANHYYKQPNHNSYFSELSEKLFSINELSQLTKEQEKILIDCPVSLKMYYDYILYINETLDNYPNDTLYRINFSDIINKPDVVKQTLETVTNVQMSNHAHRQYDRYVERQLQFRKEKDL